MSIKIYYVVQDEPYNVTQWSPQCLVNHISVCDMQLRRKTVMLLYRVNYQG